MLYKRRKNIDIYGFDTIPSKQEVPTVVQSDSITSDSCYITKTCCSWAGNHCCCDGSTATHCPSAANSTQHPQSCTSKEKPIQKWGLYNEDRCTSQLVGQQPTPWLYHSHDALGWSFLCYFFFLDEQVGKVRSKHCTEVNPYLKHYALKAFHFQHRSVRTELLCTQELHSLMQQWTAELTLCWSTMPWSGPQWGIQVKLHKGF